MRTSASEKGPDMQTDGSLNKPLVPQEESTPHLKDYWKILSARKWILISTFFLLVICTTVYVFVQTPVYMAECRLEIQPASLDSQDVKTVYDPTLSGMGGEFIRHAFLETQYELILANSVVKQTFDHFKLYESPLFKGSRNSEAAFGDFFSVEPVPNTWLADITFEWKNPMQAAKILDYLVESYLKEYRKKNKGIDEETLTAKKEKVKELQPKLQKKFDALQDFIATNELVSLDDADQKIWKHYDNLTVALEEATLKSNEASGRYENFKSALEDERLDEMPEIFNSTTIQNLKLELIAAQIQLTQLEERFGRRHPEVVIATRNIEFINNKIDIEKQCLFSTVKSEYERARYVADELQSSLAAEEKKIAELSGLLLEYQQLQKSYEAAQQKINRLQSDIADLEIAWTGRENHKEKNIHVVDRPTVPIKPIKPKKAISIALASILGLVLGVSLCFFIEYLDTSIKTKEDVERLIKTPVLGYVPPVTINKAALSSERGSNPDLVALDNPRSFLAEAFRSIRTALMFSEVGKELKSILVTSPTPGEGKTLVSLNIAITLAQAGKRVLLVDSDLRKPRLNKTLGLSREPGLSNLLASKGDFPLDRHTSSFGVENLFFIPSGPCPPNPAELLASSRMKEIVNDLSASYDHVFFDTPPIINATDAATLAQHVNGAILVIRSFKTERSASVRAREILSNAQVNVLGAVLNNADVPKNGYGGYYQYYYNQYYTHYGDGKTRTVRKRRRRKSPKTETGGKVSPGKVEADTIGTGTESPDAASVKDSAT